METIVKLRKRILEVAFRDGMGHIPSALSILDIVWTLYDKVMTKDDQFILSKGHGCMALYAVLEEKGLLDWSTKLWGHPKRGGAILASTGSLGHGLPMAVGLAMAKKIKGEPGRVFVLVGDGECNEGTTWESAMLAAHHKLDNLVLIVDQNHSSDRALDTGNLNSKFEVFGFKSLVVNYLTPELKEYFGTDNDINERTFHIGWTEKEKPSSFIVNTIKGKGVPFMENNFEWHNKKLDKKSYEAALS
jgi:transketolase